MTGRLRYQVAASLDGFIARPDGAYDWIVSDPAIDFAALFSEFDTAVMGRKTYDAVVAGAGEANLRGLETIVFSRTLAPSSKAGIRITNEEPGKVVAGLKASSGRDIWLFGGGGLFRTLLDAGQVDTVEVAVMPVLLGEGIPILPPGTSTRLELRDSRVLPASGIVSLAYTVEGSTAAAPRIDYVRNPD